MYFLEEEVYKDLYSKDPKQIEIALENLVDNMHNSYYLDINKFGLEVLEPLGDKVTQETQINFIDLINGYLFPQELDDKEKEKIFLNKIW